MLIYTCIENNYAALPADMPPGHEYICYGDAEAVGPWKVYPSKDYGNPVRTSRYYKILCPFDGPSIYCDATKLKFLNRTFFELSEIIFEKDKMFCLQHPHKHSYLNECMEYYRKGWVSYEDIINFTSYLTMVGFDFSEWFSPLNTILWRNNQNEFNMKWWDLYMRGGVRDQLSYGAALPLLEKPFMYDYSLEFLNHWTDAGRGGKWWNVRQGDYSYSKPDREKELLTALCKMTGLSRLRYKPCCRI